MAQLKKAKKSKKTTTVAVKFTAEQKKIIKAQITLAVEEAYLQGREDEARANEKIALAREKAIVAAAAKFDKEHKKAAKPKAAKKVKKAAKKATPVKKAKAEKKVAAKKSAKTATKKIAKPAAKKVTKPAVKKAKVKAKKTSVTTGNDASKKRGRPAKTKVESHTEVVTTPEV